MSHQEQEYPTQASVWWIMNEPYTERIHCAHTDYPHTPTSPSTLVFFLNAPPTQTQTQTLIDTECSTFCHTKQSISTEFTRTNTTWNDITHVAFQILQPTTFWKIFFKVSQSICPDNTFLPWDLYRFYFMCHKWFYGWWCLSHTTSCSFYAFYVPPTPWLMYNSKYATTAKYSRLSLHVMYTPLFPELCGSNVFV